MTYRYQGRLYSDRGELYVRVRPSSGVPGEAFRNKGWAFDADGYSYVEEAPAVIDASTSIIQESMAYTMDGALLVSVQTPGSLRANGIAIRPDGAVYVTTTNTGSVFEGRALSILGQLVLVGEDMAGFGFNNFLLESGDDFLMEDGSAFLMEIHA